jgi:hypothetical protein
MDSKGQGVGAPGLTPLWLFQTATGIRTTLCFLDHAFPGIQIILPSKEGLGARNPGK